MPNVDLKLFIFYSVSSHSQWVAEIGREIGREKIYTIER